MLNNQKECPETIYNELPNTKAQKFRRKVFIMKWKLEEDVRKEKGKVKLSDLAENKKYQTCNRVLAIIH